MSLEYADYERKQLVWALELEDYLDHQTDALDIRKEAQRLVERQATRLITKLIVYGQVDPEVTEVTTDEDRHKSKRTFRYFALPDWLPGWFKKWFEKEHTYTHTDVRATHVTRTETWLIDPLAKPEANYYLRKACGDTPQMPRLG